MNRNELRALMIRHGDTQAVLAEAMGLPVSALNQRINGKIEFRRNEIKFIKARYNLTAKETDELFFEDVVA